MNGKEIKTLIEDRLLLKFIRARGYDPKHMDQGTKMAYARSDAFKKFKMTHKPEKNVRVDIIQAKKKVKESADQIGKPTPSAEEIAKKHGISVHTVNAQIEKGIKVEKEHTKSEAQAHEIARDHLSEFPDYYDRLDKMEKAAKKVSEENLNEISKETIARYMTKTVDPVYGMPKPTKKLAQRLKGMSRAHQRIIGKKPTSEETITEAWKEIDQKEYDKLHKVHKGIVNNKSYVEKREGKIHHQIFSYKSGVPTIKKVSGDGSVTYHKSVTESDAKVLDRYIRLKGTDPTPMTSDQKNVIGKSSEYRLFRKHHAKLMPDPKEKKEEYVMESSKAAKLVREIFQKKVEENLAADALAAVKRNNEWKKKHPQKSGMKKSESKKEDKKLKEDLHDWEKEDKSGVNVEPKASNNKISARAVLKGGKTMTGKNRDVIELDPFMKNRPGPGTKMRLPDESGLATK